MNNFGTSLNSLPLDEFETFSKCYHAQCFFFEFSLLLIIDHLWLSMWVTIEDWKMDEEGSADE